MTDAPVTRLDAEPNLRQNLFGKKPEEVILLPKQAGRTVRLRDTSPEQNGENEANNRNRKGQDGDRDEPSRRGS